MKKMHFPFSFFGLFITLAIASTVSALALDDLVIDNENITLTSGSTITYAYDNLLASGITTLTVDATGKVNLNDVTVHFSGNYLPSSSSPYPTTLRLWTNQATFGDRTHILFDETLPTAITPTGIAPEGWRPILDPSITMKNPDHAARLSAVYQDAETGELTAATNVVADFSTADQFSIFQSAAKTTLENDKTIYVLDFIYSLVNKASTNNILSVASGLVLIKIASSTFQVGRM